uniref:Cilia- and flagella-associated protein 418 n=1 Tax=Neogobius melanostomus TaxID=47308 RepID=A0A8C6T2R1_9GOBI
FRRLLDKLLEEESADFTPTKVSIRHKCPNTEIIRSYSFLIPLFLCRCCPVFIGGSSVQTGIGTATSKRSCDQLRCTSCDFSVLTFDDCEWDSGCDYLFFRNNVPERPKLQSKLRRRRAFRAYCCQCSWTSVSELTELMLMLTPPLRWVCAGKHQD